MKLGRKNARNSKKIQLGKRWRHFFEKFRQNPQILKSRVSVSEFLMKSRSRNFWSLGLVVLTRSRSQRLRSRLHHCYLVLPMRKESTIEIDLSNIYFILRIRFNKISLFRMLLTHLKLHQITTIFRWCDTKFFLHTSMQNYHLATLFDNTNVVSNPQKGNQNVRVLFCQTFTEYCQITNNNAKILAKFLH